MESHWRFGLTVCWISQLNLKCYSSKIITHQYKVSCLASLSDHWLLTNVLNQISLNFCGTMPPMVIRNPHKDVWRSKARADFFLAQTVDSCSQSMRVMTWADITSVTSSKMHMKYNSGSNEHEQDGLFTLSSFFPSNTSGGETNSR